MLSCSHSILGFFQSTYHTALSVSLLLWFPHRTAVLKARDLVLFFIFPVPELVLGTQQLLKKCLLKEYWQTSGARNKSSPLQIYCKIDRGKEKCHLGLYLKKKCVLVWNSEDDYFNFYFQNFRWGEGGSGQTTSTKSILIITTKNGHGEFKRCRTISDND